LDNTSDLWGTNNYRANSRKESKKARKDKVIRKETKEQRRKAKGKKGNGSIERKERREIFPYYDCRYTHSAFTLH
jgi:hypothetical protein